MVRWMEGERELVQYTTALHKVVGKSSRKDNKGVCKTHIFSQSKC